MYIKVAKTVEDQTPEEFKKLLSDEVYRLTKTKSSRPCSMVYAGDTVVGEIEIVDVKGTNLPGLRIQGHHYTNYLRTSPIVKVIDTTENSITFITEGGEYLLEKVNYNA